MDGQGKRQWGEHKAADAGADETGPVCDEAGSDRVVSEIEVSAVLLVAVLLRSVASISYVCSELAA